jgi:hypothetical protein
MRLAILLSAVAAALAAAALVAVGLHTDLLEFDRGAPETGALAPEARRAALLGGLETVGYGAERDGVAIREAGGAAVFSMPGGREVRVAPPEGYALTGEFVILSELSGGFFLEPEKAGPAGAPHYVAFVDARRRLEPGTSAEGLTLYEQAAGRIREAGRLPFLDGAMQVVSVEAAQDRVRYCLRREDGMLFEGGTRFVGPLSVTAMVAGDCPEDPARIAERLRAAEASLAGNR